MCFGSWSELQRELSGYAQHESRGFNQCLVKYGMNVEIVDPWIDLSEAQRAYGLKVRSEIHQGGVLVQLFQQ